MADRCYQDTIHEYASRQQAAGRDQEHNQQPRHGITAPITVLLHPVELDFDRSISIRINFWTIVSGVGRTLESDVNLAIHGVVRRKSGAVTDGAETETIRYSRVIEIKFAGHLGRSAAEGIGMIHGL